MEILILFIFTFLIIVAIVLYQSFSWGYVSSILYKWFILPFSPELPELTWIQLAGVMFFVTCFFHSSTTSYLKDEVKDNKSCTLTLLIYHLITLVVDRL